MKKFTSVFLLLGCLLPTQAQNVPPCTFEIVDAETFSTQWTVIDNNQAVSPNTWVYSEDGTWYEQDKSSDADDWIIAPAVTLDAGKTYNVSAYVKHESSFFYDCQKIELKIGREATVDGLTTRLFSDESFKSQFFVEKSGTFSPDESGTYYIGLHCYSDSFNGDLYLQKIVVEEAPIYPAQISDLTVEAGNAGELSAHLSWTWPSTDQYGNPLTLLSGAKIYRDGDLITTIEEATIGQTADWTDQTIERAGSYDYEVVAYNSFGEAPGEAASVTSPWIGTDTPEAVTQLTATAENETVTLSFTPPTAGKNGGYIDPAALTYQISRTPGGVLTEDFSGPLPYVDVVPELGSYTYTVTATFDGKSSDPVTSNRVVAGGMKELPYNESFDTESALELFTIIDGNNDGKSWRYYSSKQLMQFYGGYDADEWLITPQLSLQAGKNYKLVFKTGLERASSSDYKDLYVTIGSQATAESQSRQLFHETIESALMEEKEIIFSVTESGGYYIGFHCLGATSYYAIFVDDLAIAETVEVPAAVSDLTVTPGENGALSATIQWTNPSLSAAGTPLSHLTKMELYRNETLIDTQLEPEMGTAQQFVDETIPAPGSYLYKVVGYVDENAGEATTTESAWIGVDIPMPVTELTLSNVDGTPHLSFRTPAGGANGGYIDRESIIYRIVRNPGNELLTEQLTDTTYIDTDDLALALYSYEVTALLGDTESEPATSNALVFGGALALPYETEMATADETALWTIVDGNNDGKSWVYNDDDDDMEYTAYSAADDWLFTPPFKAGKGSHTLDFRASANSYRYPESMEITLSKDVVPGESQQVIASYPEIRSTLPELYSVDFDVPEEGDWYLGFHITSPDPWGLYLSYCSIKSNVASAIDETLQTAGIYYQRESQSLVLKSTGHLDVVDVRGATVISCQVEGGTLDVSQLPTGLYIARWTAEGEKSEQIKFIK